MCPEMSHHISVPRLASLWSGTGSPRAAGTTWGASPRRGATRRILITSFTGSGNETGILSYYLHLGNYSQPPHPEKTSLENKSSPSPGTQHGPTSHGGDNGPFRASTQGTGSSWVNRAGLVSRSCRWCPAVKRAEPRRVGGGRQHGAAGKHAGNQLMLGRRQQQAQLAGERCRDPGQRLETTTAQRHPGGEARQGVGSPLEQPPRVAGSAEKAHCVYPPAIKPRKVC